MAKGLVASLTSVEMGFPNVYELNLASIPPLKYSLFGARLAKLAHTQMCNQNLHKRRKKISTTLYE